MNDRNGRGTVEERQRVSKGHQSLLYKTNRNEKRQKGYNKNAAVIRTRDE